MTPLTTSEAEAWLDAYGRAWADGDADALLSLFTPHAEYRETPFGPPMVGHAAIRRYWQAGAAEGQRDVRFGFTLWAVQGTEAFAHWTASFTRAATGEPVRIDGAFALAFVRDAEGTPLCATLREWWHRA
jgi:ketosteroid isomerase-like protein